MKELTDYKIELGLVDSGSQNYKHYKVWGE